MNITKNNELLVNTTFLGHQDITVAYCKQYNRVFLHAVSFATQYLSGVVNDNDIRFNLVLPCYGGAYNLDAAKWDNVNRALAKYVMSFDTFKEGLLCMCIEHPDDNIKLSEGLECILDPEIKQVIFDCSVFNSLIWWQCLSFNMTLAELIEVCTIYEGNEMKLHKMLRKLQQLSEI